MFPLRKNFQGQRIQKTSVGNTTFIDHRDKLFLTHNTYIGHHNFIEASHEIHIEEGCQITDFVSITTHSSHISIRLLGAEYHSFKNPPGYVTGAVHIGKYTFVGPHTLIMPGTKIGKGCIISAYSYVKGDFPDFSIIKGNPATVTGSTKDLDQKYLDEFPDLKPFYEEWSK